MKRWFALSTLALACANAYAAPPYHPTGPNLTYGAVSNNQTIISNVTNPSAGAAVFTKEDSQYRFGILSSIGFGYEFGQVDDLYDEIDNTQSQLQDTQQLDYQNVCATATTQAECENLVATELNQTIIASVNRVMNAVQADGYASGFFSGHVPVMPLVISHKGLGGSFVLDASFSAKADMTFISDTIPDLTGAQASQIIQGGTITNGQLNYDLSSLNTDSTMLVKGGAVAEVGLGYSRMVMTVDAGQLAAGFRAKYYKVGLTRVAQRLLDADSAEDTFDADKDYVYRSGFGIDVGALWIATHYRVGAWVDNINKPSFKFNDIDTTGYTDAATIAELQKSDTYEMNSQLHLEGAVFTESQNWVLNVGLDANEAKDATGAAYKWATVSAGYATDSWWIPGFRVGYRANMAGTELTYLTGGLTLFKTANLDLAYGLDSVEVDGEKAPRSFMMNLGFELTF